MTYCLILMLNSSDVNKRKKTIIAITVSLTLFVILGFTAFGFWRRRVEQNGNTLMTLLSKRSNHLVVNKIDLLHLL